MKLNFCYICGGKLSESEQRPWTCTECGQEFFGNPHPGVEIVLFNDEGQVLVSKRGQEPYKGKLDFPGGFVDGDETLEQALKREVEEELQLSDTGYTIPEMLLSYSAKYPFGHEVHQVLVTVFVAYVKPGATPKAADDVESVKWIHPESVDLSTLAVPEQARLISKVIDYKEKKGEINA